MSKTASKTLPIADVHACAPRGMITLRGDLTDPTIAAAVLETTGQQVPAQRAMHMDGENGVAWMSPDELLILCPIEDVEHHLSTLNARLEGQFAMVVDVSDARTVFAVGGPNAREVLAKLMPVDLSRDAFGAGQVRRTRAAQIAAAVWMTDTDVFEVMCFRSYAQYLRDLLNTAASPGSAPNVL